MNSVIAKAILQYIKQNRGKPVSEEDLIQYLPAQGIPSEPEEIQQTFQDLYAAGFIYPIGYYWYITSEGTSSNNSVKKIPKNAYDVLRQKFKQVNVKNRDNFIKDWKNQVTKYYEHFKLNHPEYSKVFDWLEKIPANYDEFLRDTIALYNKLDMTHQDLAYPKEPPYLYEENMHSVEQVMQESIRRFLIYFKEHSDKGIDQKIYRNSYDKVNEIIKNIDAPLKQILFFKKMGTMITKEEMSTLVSEILKGALPKNVSSSMFFAPIYNKIREKYDPSTIGIFLPDSSVQEITTSLTNILQHNVSGGVIWNTFKKTAQKGILQSVINKMFVGEDYSGANLAAIDLEDLKIKSCIFVGTNMAGSKWTDSVIEGCTFENANLNNSVFKPSTFLNNYIEGADFEGAAISKNIEWEKQTGYAKNIEIKEINNIDKKEYSKITNMSGGYSHSIPLRDAELNDAALVAKAIHAVITNKEALSFLRFNGLSKTAEISPNDVNELKKLLKDPSYKPRIDYSQYDNDPFKWLISHNQRDNSELRAAGFSGKELNTLFGYFKSQTTKSPEKPIEKSPEEIAQQKLDSFIAQYSQEKEIPKNALLDLIINKEGILYKWISQMSDNLSVNQLYQIYHALVSTLKELHLNNYVKTLVRRYEPFPYSSYFSNLKKTLHGVAGGGTQFGIAIMPDYSLVPKDIADDVKRAIISGSTHLHGALAFSRITPYKYTVIRESGKPEIKKVWYISEMQSDVFQKIENEWDWKDKYDTKKPSKDLPSDAEKAQSAVRSYFRHWPETLLNEIIKRAGEEGVNEIWMPRGSAVVAKGSHTGPDGKPLNWYNQYDRPAKTFGGELKNTGVEINLDPGASSNKVDNEFYIIPLQHEKTASLKFHSWKMISDFGEFEKILKQKEYSYHIDGSDLIVDYKGVVDLSFQISLPKNIQFNNGGYVNLRSLTSLPENIQFNNRGDVYLHSLTSLPENIRFNNKENVYLNSLTALPDNIQFNNGGYVNLRSLTSLPENKYEIFKNGGKVFYNWDGTFYKKFDPNIREASLKLSWDTFREVLGEVNEGDIIIDNGNDTYKVLEIDRENKRVLLEEVIHANFDKPFWITESDMREHGFVKETSLKFSDLQDYDWEELKKDLEDHFRWIESNNRSEHPQVRDFLTDDMLAQFAYKTFFNEYKIPQFAQQDPEFIEKVKKIIKEDLGYKLYGNPYLDWAYWLELSLKDVNYFITNQRQTISPDMNVSDKELARDWLNLWRTEAVPGDIQRAPYYDTLFIPTVAKLLESKGYGDTLSENFILPQSIDERIENVINPIDLNDEGEKEFVDREGNPLNPEEVKKEEDFLNELKFKVPEKTIDEYLDELNHALAEGDADKAALIKQELKRLQSNSSLKFHSWKVVPEFGEFENILKEKGYSYHIDGLNLIVDHEGGVWADFLTSLPENIQFNNGGSVNLRSLTSLPENTQFYNRGDVYLHSLTSLPENIRFNNKENVYLNSLTSLPESTRFNNKGSVYLNLLTQLPENKYEIFKNGDMVFYSRDGHYLKRFNPHIREASLKFSNDTYFDSTPSEERTPEEIFSLNPPSDEKLKRTNPKRYDQRADWYTQNNEAGHDSDMVNKYDNPISLETRTGLIFEESLHSSLEELDWEINTTLESSKMQKEASINNEQFIDKLKQRFELNRKLSWKVIPEFDEFEKILKQRGYSYHIDGSTLIVNPEEGVWLNSLTSLPENIQFNNGDSVYLASLKSLPKNIQFNNKGSVDLNSLTFLPENIQFNNGDIVWLNSITSLPKNKYEIFKNGGVVFYDWNGDHWKEFDPHIREASLKFNVYNNIGEIYANNIEETQKNKESENTEDNYQKSNEEAPQNSQKVVIEYLDVQDIIEIHNEIVSNYGGLAGTNPRTEASLEAALGRMTSGFGDTELYPSLIEKAAVLMHSIITTHPFNDGNKRTAFLAAVYFLHNNGISTEESESLVDVIISVASDASGYDHLLQWLQTNAHEIQRKHDRALRRLT